MDGIGRVWLDRGASKMNPERRAASTIESRPRRSPEDPIPAIDRLRSIFARYADIQAVYLFGSAARGTARAESDLDLAIVSRSPASPSRKLDLLADLARHGFCDVDLVFLDAADIVTQYEAVRLNRLIYEAEDFDRGAMYSRVVRRYLDFLPYLEVQRAATKRRILSGQG